MITLYTFGRALGLPDLSPFVMKAEMLLKLAELDYRVVHGNIRKAPKGKLPYIEDEGLLIPDSTFIRWHIERKYGVDFDHHLTPAEKAVAWSVEKMLEDNYYWVMVNDRWINDNNFAKGPAQFFSGIPWPIRGMVVSMIRHKVRNNLHGQGTSRHNAQEIAAIAARDVEAVATILCEKPYLMGEQPCGADATIFAFIAQMLCAVFETAARNAAEKHLNLVAYSSRMMQTYYPDLATT
jgi:glutathione S-transferase